MRILLAIGVVGIMAGAALATAGLGSERRIEIRIEHSRFDPGRINVDAGETVTFVIHNDDPIAHEFIVGDPEVQRAHEEGTEAHHDAIPTEISVPGGTTRVTTIEFAEDGFLVASHPLLFGCHLPGHYDYGMRGVIEVH